MTDMWTRLANVGNLQLDPTPDLLSRCLALTEFFSGVKQFEDKRKFDKLYEAYTECVRMITDAHTELDNQFIPLEMLPMGISMVVGANKGLTKGLDKAIEQRDELAARHKTLNESWMGMHLTLCNAADAVGLSVDDIAEDLACCMGTGAVIVTEINAIIERAKSAERAVLARPDITHADAVFARYLDIGPLPPEDAELACQRMIDAIRAHGEEPVVDACPC